MMSRPLAGDASWPESWLKDVASRGGDAGRPETWDLRHWDLAPLPVHLLTKLLRHALLSIS